MVENKIKIINKLTIIILVLFFLGQGVWFYQVREMKVTEFKSRAGYLINDEMCKYLAQVGKWQLACGKFTFGYYGEGLGWGKDPQKCIPFSSVYDLTPVDIQLTYDHLYENLDLDVRKLDILFRGAFEKSDMPPLAYWLISDRNTGKLLLTCGKMTGPGSQVQTIPVNLGWIHQHQLVAFLEVPILSQSFAGVFFVEVIFLIGFILSLCWQWYYVHTFWREAEVKMMGTAHLEHELRKPIAILLNTVEDLTENGKTVLTGREQLKLKMMKVRLIKMADVTNTLLTICRNTNLGLNRVDLDVRGEMDLVLELFSVLKPYAEIRLQIAAGAEQACLDEVYFCYMIINLVDNAIKYSGDHPQISIDCCKENDKFVVAVSDNGIGIPKRKQKRIFRPFYRINNRCVRRTTGFGLGLTFVRKVVDTYGGEIHVESIVGSGSSFIIVLPQKNENDNFVC